MLYGVLKLSDSGSHIAIRAFPVRLFNLEIILNPRACGLFGPRPMSGAFREVQNVRFHEVSSIRPVSDYKRASLVVTVSRRTESKTCP